MLTSTALLLLAAVSTAVGAQRERPPCVVGGDSCPSEYPCCSRDGWCSDTPSDCTLGCQPYLSHNVSDCAPNPVCENWSTDFRDEDGVSRIYQGEGNRFNGDPEAYDWAVTGLETISRDLMMDEVIVEEDDGVRLACQPQFANPFIGTRLTSTRYMHYGTVDVVMKSAPWQGMATTFMLMSDVREIIRFDLVNGTTNETVATQGILDRMEAVPSPNADSSSNLTYDSERFEMPGDASAEFHKYTIDWQEESIRWLIDDEEIRVLNRSALMDLDGLNQFPTTPARIELSLKAGHYYGDDSDDSALRELGYYWMTIQSVDVKCYRAASDLAEGTTGYVYRERGAQWDPQIESTDQDVTVSAATMRAPSAGLSAVLLAAALVASVALV